MLPIAMTPPYPIHDVTLVEQLDVIDPPLWALWRCTVTLEDETVIENCLVQSDGLTISYESLEDEAGNPFENWSFGSDL